MFGQIQQRVDRAANTRRKNFINDLVALEWPDDEAEGHRLVVELAKKHKLDCYDFKELDERSDAWRHPQGE